MINYRRGDSVHFCMRNEWRSDKQTWKAEMTRRLHILLMHHKASPPTRMFSPTKLDKAEF